LTAEEVKAVLDGYIAGLRRAAAEPAEPPPALARTGAQTGTTSSTASPPPPATATGRGALDMTAEEVRAGLRRLGVRL
jgi:hypothetical protein